MIKCVWVSFLDKKNATFFELVLINLSAIYAKSKFDSVIISYENTMLKLLTLIKII